MFPNLYQAFYNQVGPLLLSINIYNRISNGVFIIDLESMIGWFFDHQICSKYNVEKAIGNDYNQMKCWHKKMIGSQWVSSEKRI